jgi:hypothetical protein
VTLIAAAITHDCDKLAIVIVVSRRHLDAHNMLPVRQQPSQVLHLGYFAFRRDHSRHDVPPLPYF